MVKSDNIHFKMSPLQLRDILIKVKDLVKIDNRLVIKINNQNILIFSFVGESFKNIHAFKNYIFNTQDIMIVKDEILDSLIFVVKDGKKFYRILENFINYDIDINGKIYYDEDNYVNFITFDNKKLNTKIIGGDPITISKDINIEDINYLMNIENSIFNFRIENVDFEKIRRMSIIDKIKKDVIYINIKDNKVLIGETKWHINLGDIEFNNMTISFPKDYFISMNPKDFILSYVFEGFILFKYDDYNLMIILETGSK